MSDHTIMACIRNIRYQVSRVAEKDKALKYLKFMRKANRPMAQNRELRDRRHTCGNLLFDCVDI